MAGTGAFGQPVDDEDPWTHPEAKRWMANVRREMVPKLAASAVSMTVWRGNVDVKLAVEVGFSILMDKPLILMVQPGTKVPSKLALVADEILEVDMKADPAKASRSIGEALDRLREKFPDAE